MVHEIMCILTLKNIIKDVIRQKNTEYSDFGVFTWCQSKDYYSLNYCLTGCDSHVMTVC